MTEADKPEILQKETVLRNTRSLELSLKSLKNQKLFFGREFRPTFDSYECLRSVQVVFDPPILAK